MVAPARGATVTVGDCSSVYVSWTCGVPVDVSTVTSVAPELKFDPPPPPPATPPAWPAAPVARTATLVTPPGTRKLLSPACVTVTTATPAFAGAATASPAVSTAATGAAARLELIATRVAERGVLLQPRDLDGGTE